MNKPLFMHCGNKPLFMHFGACRAIPEVNMLWLDVFGTPKNPGGVWSFRALEGNSYAIL